MKGRTSIRLTDDLLERIDKVKEKEKAANLTESDIVRMAIDAGLKERWGV
jgi:predicted DNA-binding protein